MEKTHLSSSTLMCPICYGERSFVDINIYIYIYSRRRWTLELPVGSCYHGQTSIENLFDHVKSMHSLRVIYRLSPDTKLGFSPPASPVQRQRADFPRFYRRKVLHPVRQAQALDSACGRRAGGVDESTKLKRVVGTETERVKNVISLDHQWMLLTR